MNKFGKLIKSKMIRFIDCIITYYKQIELDEMDAMIIAKCYLLCEEGFKTLDTNRMAEGVNLTPDEISNHIMNLVERGYIDFNIRYGKEIMILDGTIEKLGLVLEAKEARDKTNNSKTLLQEMIYYFEKTFDKISSSSDLFLINLWSSEYDLPTVQRAIDDALRQGKKSAPYVDAILKNNKKRKDNSIEVDENLEELLNNAYVRK